MSAKILLAEDNASNRYLATYLLRNAGFTVLTAHNGNDAIRLARAESPDLVLMDIQMPEMDGYEAAQRIHADPALAGVPIVAVTSYAMTSDRTKALELGFVGYIEKPIQPLTFVAQISKFLPGKAAHA
jgi:two-component system, cell cycle response regulator DivK